MTEREKILTMEPWRELDSKVAEIVMGWVAWEEKRGEYLHVIFQKPGDREPYRSERNWEQAATRYRQISFSEIDHHKHIVHGMRDFSTDISAAWEVVEKFHEVSVKRFETMKGHRYWCKIEIDYDSEPIIAQGDTAPEAICKAALLAVMDND